MYLSGDVKKMAADSIAVLLLEDDPGYAIQIIEALMGIEEEPIQIFHADSLPAAAGPLAEGEVDVVVFGFDLARGKGRDALKMLWTSHPEVPVLLVATTPDRPEVGEPGSAGVPDLAAFGDDLATGVFETLERQRVGPNELLTALRRATRRDWLVSDVMDRLSRDSVTGLLDRAGFLQAGDLASPRPGTPGAIGTLALVDIEGLARIRSVFGPKEADAAVNDLAEILVTTLRANDVVGRITGDRFALLAVGAHIRTFGVIKARLQAALALHNLKARRPFSIAVTIVGRQVEISHASSVEAALVRAEMTMDLANEQRRLKPRVLVADPDPAFLAWFRQAFGDEFEVTVAESGEHALRAASEAPPAVALVSLHLRDMSGGQVAAYMHRSMGAGGTKVMAIGHGELADRGEARDIEASVDDFLAGPVDEETLRARMRGLLEQLA